MEKELKIPQESRIDPEILNGKLILQKKTLRKRKEKFLTNVPVQKMFMNSYIMTMEFFKCNYLSFVGFIGGRADHNIPTLIPIYFILHQNPVTP